MGAWNAEDLPDSQSFQILDDELADLHKRLIGKKVAHYSGKRVIFAVLYVGDALLLLYPLNNMEVML